MNKKAIVNAGKEKARLISRVSSIEDEGCGRESERGKAPRNWSRKKKDIPRTTHSFLIILSKVLIEVNIKKATRIVEIDDVRAHQ